MISSTIEVQTSLRTVVDLEKAFLRTGFLVDSERKELA